MKKRKLNYVIHNPNTAEKTADFLLEISQAVSKWECGNAILDIDLLLELSHMYNVTINEMLEDVDLIYELTGFETGRKADNFNWFCEQGNVCSTSG